MSVYHPQCGGDLPLSAVSVTEKASLNEDGHLRTVAKDRHIVDSGQRQTPVNSGQKTDTCEQWPKTLWSVAKNRHLWTAAQRQTPVDSGTKIDTREQWPKTLWSMAKNRHL